jgi:hypothetical protein
LFPATLPSWVDSSMTSIRSNTRNNLFLVMP